MPLFAKFAIIAIASIISDAKKKQNYKKRLIDFVRVIGVDDVWKLQKVQKINKCTCFIIKLQIFAPA